MFDGIEMDVVRATLQIRFVTHGVFVKTPLPNTAFVPPLFAGGQVFGTREMCGEFGFNQPPVRRRFQRGIVFAHPHKPHAISRYVRQAGAILGWRV